MKQNLKFKRGDVLVPKDGSLKNFYFVLSVNPLGKYPYLCNNYNVQYGINGQFDLEASKLDKYRKANDLERKIWRFIDESDGGLECLKGKPEEKRLFSAFCSTKGDTTFTIEDAYGATRKFKLVSNSNDTGTRHILTKHFLGAVGRLEYSDIMFLLEVIKKGKCEPVGENNLKFTYRCAGSKKAYTLICYIKGAKGGKVMLIKSFYSNKK